MKWNSRVLLFIIPCVSGNRGTGILKFIRTARFLLHPCWFTGQIHICLEGDFNIGYESMSLDQKTQLFTASKIILELSRLHDISRYTCFLTPTPALGHIFHGTRL